MRNKKNSRGNKRRFGKIPSKGSSRGPRVSNPSQRECAGELSIHRDGYGFVVLPDPDSPDVFVPARYIGDAMNGDIVEARIFSSSGRRSEGRILKILERKKKLLTGRLERRREKFWVISDDVKVRHRILIDASDLSDADDGDNVVVEITRYPAGDFPPQGVVKEVLGRRGEYGTEKLALIIRHSLPRGFPLSVEKEAEKICREIEKSALLESEDRVNLFHLPFVTIDGESARDFDDAVCVEKVSGGYRLYVSIADVSLYVRPGSEVDQEAFRRGTSVYFPDQCIPMLPEILSNEKCSLNPDEPRATVTAELLVSNDGRVSREKFYRSLIKSRARMTYTDIRKILIDKDEQSIFKYGNLYRMISLMKDCHDSLRVARLARGSVDFDLPEADIVMGMDGGISSIVKAERHVGHM
ncbi:MAG TPA: RNB domain-containing ribonuclease, partial [bacterium]|nr:RNB domain-containing ribonuclease [bacterium]